MTFNNYNNNNNSYMYNRASTPNPVPRQAFQAPSVVTRKPQNIKIDFNKQTPQVVISTNQDKHSGPQVELSRPPTPVISFSQNHHDRSVAPNQNSSISITSANSGNIPLNISPIGPPKNNQSIINTQIKNPVSNPPPVQQSPVSFPSSQSDAFHRLSLLSFVSTFEDEKSFNETDLEVLGLDLKCQEPLLPMLHSVLSDAPLLDHSRHPMPECYSKIQCGDPSDKLSLFSSQTLLFIFYTYPHDPLQNQAATELQRRQWQFNEETEEWKDQDENVWSVDKWRESEENQGNELGDAMFLHRSE